MSFQRQVLENMGTFVVKLGLAMVDSADPSQCHSPTTIGAFTINTSDLYWEAGKDFCLSRIFGIQSQDIPKVSTGHEKQV